MSNAIDIAREVLGVPKAPIMDEGDEIRNLRAERDAWNASYHAANNERIQLKAEVSTLAERLRQTPDLRSIVGELRVIYTNAEASNDSAVRAGLRVLLRRLDSESQ